MRRLLGLLIIIALGVLSAAASCEEEAEVVTRATPQAADSEGEVAEQADTPDVLNLSVGDTAKVGDAEVTVHGFRFDEGNEFFSPDEGNVWLVVDVTVVNTGGNSYALSSVLQTAARDQEGREHGIAFGPDLQGSLDSQIPPGDKLRGEAAFEVPAGQAGLQFVFKQAIGSAQARWNLE
jgi:hypothetical protein